MKSIVGLVDEEPNETIRAKGIVLKKEKWTL